MNRRTAILSAVWGWLGSFVGDKPAKKNYYEARAQEGSAVGLLCPVDVIFKG